MLDKIIERVRTLIEDTSRSDFEVFKYEGVSVFPLQENNVSDVNKVTKQGVPLGSGEYSYDSTYNEVTVTASMNEGDLIEVDYDFTSHSDTELKNYINNAVVWLTVLQYKDFDFDIENECFFVTPDNAEMDLISLITSVLINQNFQSYKLPNKTVVYPQRKNLRDQMRQIVNDFKRGVGISDLINRSY